MSRTLAVFGIKLKKDLQASILAKEKAKASKYGTSFNGNSRLYGTVKLSFDDNNDPNVLTISMNDYWDIVNKGRRPGKVSKKADMDGWIKRKALNPVKIINQMRVSEGLKPSTKLTFAQATKQFGFIVRRKVQTKGFAGNHFYDEVINDGRLTQLKKDFYSEYRKDISIVINGNNNNR